MTDFILASASPARLAVLAAAGIDATVHVSGVDEDAITLAHPQATPAELVTLLAVAKAEAVFETIGADITDGVIVGCDSMLHIRGDLVGKPKTVERARAQWHKMSGHSGDLLTGHAVLQVTDGELVARATGTEVTGLRFGTPTAVELEAYLASGEPLEVAGSCTLDGLGGWFIDGVDGDPSSVIGISLPLTRRLLADLRLTVTDFWRAGTVPPTASAIDPKDR
ncbi:septum formation inhibitor Maf [Nakamurella silvestris]|nr:septum formation inhibitor Maf [Nakamurella silvestris]